MCRGSTQFVNASASFLSTIITNQMMSPPYSLSMTLWKNVYSISCDEIYMHISILNRKHISFLLSSQEQYQADNNTKPHQPRDLNKAETTPSCGNNRKCYGIALIDRAYVTVPLSATSLNTISPTSKPCFPHPLTQPPE